MTALSNAHHTREHILALTMGLDPPRGEGEEGGKKHPDPGELKRVASVEPSQTRNHTTPSVASCGMRGVRSKYGNRKRGRQEALLNYDEEFPFVSG